VTGRSNFHTCARSASRHPTREERYPFIAADGSEQGIAVHIQEYRHLRIVDPYQIFVEYESEAVIKAIGRLYIQQYASRMVVAEHGKIKLMREGISRHHC
jgi:hypothetical protein